MLLPFYQKRYLEAGCDEAGRGCYAGPVFAAAVVLPRDFYHPLLNDSKQISEAVRYELRPVIEKEAVCYSVAMVCNEEIDKINILRASFKAMHLALDNLRRKPKYLLIDGNRFTPYNDVRHKCIIKGDGLYSSIAAASVLAKTYRDDFMKSLHNEFPLYNWSSNKGYGTEEHRLAIQAHGLCKYHRMSFNINTHQLSLDFEEEGILM
ncbi:ribonuclease HII [Segetibacter sp. 3557_3]|uniref:ribonuclease HII n=1 Tax=Segetibacter sp. 3557_3 TaxID=2547429 RepID=UPI001058F7D2|nr:ribonuclease HII [Segetibacter sp. 3557_3]TDH20858.1 ribonuclease HII [Segetibacter sp. 3557_3]